jgi:ribosomal protein S10
MILLNIKIKSKNKNSLKNFLKFLKKMYNKKGLRLNLILLNYINKKNNYNKISVLTSPNANKNAQEQLLFKTYSKQAILFTFKLQKFLVLLKKIKRFLFSDVRIQIMFYLAHKITKKIVTKLFNPESFNTNWLEKRGEIPLKKN